jgi:hypothetical protein
MKDIAFACKAILGFREESDTISMFAKICELVVVDKPRSLKQNQLMEKHTHTLCPDLELGSIQRLSVLKSDRVT